MILDYANGKTDPLAFRQDFWAHGLSTTLGASSSYFLEPGHSSPSRPLDIAAVGAFEVSKPHRIALWHGGFEKAAHRLDGILPWLSGEPDEVLIPAAAVQSS